MILWTFIRTVSFLKPVQIVNQILKLIKFKRVQLVIVSPNEAFQINSFEFLKTNKTESIYFLNNKYHLELTKISWNNLTNGLLWNYNLNYLSFLFKIDNKKLIIQILNSYNKNYPRILSGRDPYPTSLRLVNLVKLMTVIDNKIVIEIITKDLNNLYPNLEYHLLGNHILENAFALYFTAHVFPENTILVQKAIVLLEKELNEQILNDGGHYERSYMYHLIIFGKLLESISLSENNRYNWNITFIQFLRLKAEHMFAWMMNISDNCMTFPRFNDSIEEIAPDISSLIELAKKLNINYKKTIKLSDSGYRILRSQGLLITANIGEITPSYQPGHAHADSLSFTLHSKGKPIIVDPGISTYEKNKQRKLERSTSYHNTVSINGKNNNEVWSAFRVGRRAKITLLNDSTNYLEAEHDGYRFLKSTCRRSWEIKDSKIVISDYLNTPEENACELNIHLHPEVEIKTVSNRKYLLNNEIVISFDSPRKIKLENYEYCEGFNKTRPSKRINILLNQSLTTEIFYENSFHNG